MRILVRHFATAKLKLDPTLLPRSEKFLAVPNLGQIIVLVDIDPKLDLSASHRPAFLSCRAWKDRNEIFRAKRFWQTGGLAVGALRPGFEPAALRSARHSDNFMTPSFGRSLPK